MNQIYQEDNFKIYKASHNYIVHNSDFDFEKKHTHIRNFKQAKNLIYCVKKKIIPKTFSFYLLNSLIRLSDDVVYKNKIDSLIAIRKQKGHKQSFRKLPSNLLGQC